jgi:hypothetical protein
MKTTTIECAVCGIEVDKPTKEINRQKKKGRDRFYCSLKCSGKDSNLHLRQYDNTEYLISDNRKDEYTGLREHFRRAKKRHKDFNLTLDDLLELWNNQSGKCAYTGVELEHPSSKKSTGNYNYMASLDRIDNNKGYIKGNIQFVSVSCNWLKNRMGDKHMQEFFQIVSG